MQILVEEVRSKGIEALDDLSEGQKEYFIPQAYRFGEQIRVGEYDHNLRVLAKVIAADLVDETARADSAKALRLARKMEGLTPENLVVLGCCRDAFIQRARNNDPEPPYILPSVVVEGLPKSMRDMGETRRDDSLVELLSRGILRDAALILGHGYCETCLYRELVAAAYEVVLAEGGA
jgi:hypothetical protein